MRDRETLERLIETNAEKDGTNFQGALRDILTDLRHAAKEMGLDFDFAAEGSQEVFEEEELD